MSEIDQFFRQAGKIHDMHIEQADCADVVIATNRIEKYFKGELKLGWKSIIYEINKLPELQRNHYFKRLVETEVTKAIIKTVNETYDGILPIVNKYKKAWKTLLFSNLFLLTTIILLTLKGI